jgi:circadian clock protein KaiC
LRGGIYILMGRPGTGKTILGNQICFNIVAAGGRAIYVTLLAETHARMLVHLQSLHFFTSAPIASSLHYFSGYRELEQGGLSSLLDLLRRLIRDHRPTALVLDGLAAAQTMSASDSAFKHFIHELHVFGEASGCTMFLLTQVSDSGSQPEHTIVDGLIELSDNMVGARAVRELLVRKFRGSSHLRGRHFFDITEAGIVVYPRTEAALTLPSEIAAPARQRLPFGIARLDEMLAGGLLANSTTLAMGPSGSGKTTLGLHFLAAGAARGEPGLCFGFFETPPRLIDRADRLGLDFSGQIERGLLGIIWQPALENLLDELTERMLAAVRQRGARRLFVDGFNAFQESAIYPDRIGRYMSALTNELRARDVTTIFTFETPKLFGPTLDVPAAGISEIVDNLIYLRYFELRSQLYRMISVLEARDTAHDTAIREFAITDRGIDVAATFESAEAILTGIGRPSEPDDRPAGKRSARTRRR